MQGPNPIIFRKSALPLEIIIETDASFNSGVDSSKSQGGYVVSTHFKIVKTWTKFTKTE